MPLAFPLFVFLAVVLSGCAPSARTPSAPADTGKLSPRESGNAGVAFCSGEPTRGIAEVVAAEPDRLRFRFYPGDQLFEMDRSEYQVFGVRLGDELRAVRAEGDGDNCERLSFRLFNDRLPDTGSELVGIHEA